MMKEIVAIGNFGKEGKIDGQIMKTRTIYNSIRKQYSQKYNIVKVDTSNKNIFFYFNAIKQIIVAHRIIILPAYSALKPLLFLINILGASSKTIHIAIGGWLDKYLTKAKWIKIENKFIAVLVEMKSLKKSLEELGLRNAVYFPNYREETGEKVNIKIKSTPYKKFIFYARVIPEKGVLEAIEAINSLNKKENKYALDIYGPVDESFNNEFFSRVNKIENVEYKGVLEQGKIISTLNKYDALLFPTYYKGEGFPGTILESFMAGVPVIASRWKYNEEIIENGITGLICETKSAESIVNCIKELNDNLTKYEHMPINCKKSIDQYSEEKSTAILFKFIDKN